MSLACFVTDYQLNVLDDAGYEAVIHHSQEQMDAMGECKSAEQVATELLEYVQKYAPEPKKALLAGNTVHADKAFLVKEPYRKVVRHLHHRILDVSAIKEAAKRWAPIDVLKASPQKAGKHEAKADILESIEEARYYKKVFFDKETSVGQDSVHDQTHA
ncbi:Phosphatidylinositol 3,4,5-trisphosphate-dependent Rac exchanger 2 protein [Taxawa tesnikishii (nom. ined.)]|nr:Phosphatidylinositol 3,4,5-trisphosphate-dependent Rac exchanger 2 protein [Dothideales sp. JES 119]